MTPRLDTIAHLMEDLRRQHPRLVLLVGEQHDSIESRKLFKQLADGADIGFFEARRDPRDALGTECARGSLDAQRVLKKAEGNHQLAAFIDAMLTPQVAVVVDSHEHRGANIGLSYRALDRLLSDGAPPHSRIRKAVEDIHRTRVLDRVERSNAAMTDIIARQLAVRFPGNTPFFATFMVGNGHLLGLDRLNLEGTKSDIPHTLKQKGYHVVTLNIEPIRPLLPRQRPGQYVLAQELGRKDMDFSLSVIDAKAQGSERWR